VKEVKEDKAVAHARGASLAQEHVQVLLTFPKGSARCGVRCGGSDFAYGALATAAAV
jgi:hypothetical protein